MRDVLGRPLTAANTPGARKGQAPPNAGRKFPAEVLTPDEMRRLLDAALHPVCGTAGRDYGYVPPSAPRNHALLTVLWRCGLRTGEARALMPSDLNLPARVLKVPKSKTPAGLRAVGVDDIAAESLERWLQVRAALGVGDRSPIFCTVLGAANSGSYESQRGRATSSGNYEPGRPLNAGFPPEMIKRCARQAGIAKRVHCHGLRHTFAAEIVREGHALPVISKAMGHADTLITHAYLNSTIARNEVIEAMQRRGCTVPTLGQDGDLAAGLAELIGRLEALAAGEAELTERLEALTAS